MSNVHTSYFMLGLFVGFLLCLCIVALFAVYWIKKGTSLTKEVKASESLGELQENYTILLKTSRRCARDLHHAAQLIDGQKFGDEVKNSFYARYQHYETVLGGTNEYRLDLHRQIDLLRDEADEWKAICNEQSS
jgi:uncharacterized SAM-binding protein YcdF (DUF218 family)